ncbi:hypothetical protein HWI79_3441 [Cryptosporidium felis]|nr:hypothetical protein HWI79_3441 [Cryptosporidium felis]
MLVYMLSFTLFLSGLNAEAVGSSGIGDARFIKDEIFRDVISQMNLTNEYVLKDEDSEIYKIFVNETSANNHESCKNQLHTLKFANKTHICFILGEKNNQIFNELFNFTNWNETHPEKVYLKDLLRAENLTKSAKDPGDGEGISEMIFLSQNQTLLRYLGNFHELSYNEIKHRRNRMRRRYIDDIDDDKISKTEKKRRKKRRKKNKKREKKLREKRRKYKSPLDKLRSTIKWMACVEISLAVCGCCLTIIQGVVLPFVSPIPLGSRIHPVNGQFARGFEYYGTYSGFPMNLGNLNPNPLLAGNANYGDIGRNLGGNGFRGGVFGALQQQFQGNREVIGGRRG